MLTACLSDCTMFQAWPLMTASCLCMTRDQLLGQLHARRTNTRPEHLWVEVWVDRE